MHFIWVSMYLARKCESANWGHYINVSYWRRDRHFTWSSEKREGLATCSAKGVRSFLSYLRPWVLVRPRESNLRPPALQSSALPTELILPQQAFCPVHIYAILTKFLFAFLWTVKIIRCTSSFFSASTSQEHSYLYSTNYLPFVL